MLFNFSPYSPPLPPLQQDAAKQGKQYTLNHILLAG